nr:hypothetical protein OH837_06655 [Streptomyces canus]
MRKFGTEKAIWRLAARAIGPRGQWGARATSYAAPHHPMRHTDRDWMRRVNSRVTAA